MREECADIVAQIESAEDIIADDEKFRKKLGIGADAYRLLKTASWLGPAAFGGVTGAAVASSPIVATTFFGGTASTVAGWLGLGLAATTPVGWVVAAGVVTGTAASGAYAIYRKKCGKSWSTRCPDRSIRHWMSWQRPWADFSCLSP